MPFKFRSFAYCLPLVAILAAACNPGASDGIDNTGGGGGGGSAEGDEDGDGIKDADEGDGDADDDGIPNSEDDDSDGDGIPDDVEAGDGDPETPPVDSDEDGTPDFLDTDSDDNGIPDAEDGTDDLDDDGTADYADLDDDGDGIHDDVEIEAEGADCDDDGEEDATGSADDPNDCDGDGTPDYHDLDSDNDTIGDAHEGGLDSDGDDFRDRYDLDSDNDTFPDSEEAGDDEVATAPVDTDDDDLADYVDPDSDSDGVKDIDEAELGTDRLDVDSDDDGISDLVEVVAGTDPTDETSNPQANGDFVFVVPYQEPTTPPEDTVRFRTNIQFADVYFAFDITGSMTEELAAMRNAMTGVPQIVDDLVCGNYGDACNLDADCGVGVCFQNQCIQDPNLGSGCIPDLWTGVGRWGDQNTYKNLLSLQPSATATASAIPTTGGGGSEAIFQPSHCIADPLLCPAIPAASMTCAATGTGCPGFRDEAIKIYVQITDADNQCSGATCSSWTAASAGAALQSADIEFVSLVGFGSTGETNTVEPEVPARQLGIAAGTVDASGQPFVFRALNGEVVGQTVAALLALARGRSLDTTIDATDDPSDSVDATQFIDYLEVNVSGTGECDIVSPTADTDGNSYHDAFPVLYPGKHVCWDVHPVLQNTTVMPTEDPQVFKAVLTVKGDGSPLDEREIFFLVPPEDVIIAPPR